MWFTHFLQYMVQKGIIYINDMYKENGSLYTIQELQDIYKIKINFLTYNGLIASINSFKSLIQNDVDLKKSWNTPLGPIIAGYFLKVLEDAMIFMNSLIETLQSQHPKRNGNQYIILKLTLGETFILHHLN